MSNSECQGSSSQGQLSEPTAVPQLSQALRESQQHTLRQESHTVKKCMCHKNKEHLTIHLGWKQNSQITLCL